MKQAAVLMTICVGIINCQQCRPTPEEERQILLTEVDSYDKFIFDRYLTIEKKTCEVTRRAIDMLYNRWDAELLRPAIQALDQLDAVKKMVAGTEAQGCVGGLQFFVDFHFDRGSLPPMSTTHMRRRAADFDEKYKFADCISGPKAKVGYISTNICKDRADYRKVVNRAKEGIKSCYKNFPENCPNQQRTSCTERQLETFKSEGKQLSETLNTESLCMNNFKRVLTCLNDSVVAIQKKGEKFLGNLYNCAQLVQDEKLQEAINALRKPFNFKSDLLTQVETVQNKYLDKNNHILKLFDKFYKEEKNAKNTIEFNPHGAAYFKKMWYKELEPYFKGIDRARQENELIFSTVAKPCEFTALDQLNFIIKQETQNSLKNEAEILKTTLYNMGNVRNILGGISMELSYLGNLAVLDCLEQGLIFRPNAIESCYNLKYRDFEISKDQHMKEVNKLMEDLMEQNRTYFSQPENLSAREKLQTARALWRADLVLDNLNKCLYAVSGTSYLVTPLTTTTSTTPAPGTSQGYDRRLPTAPASHPTPSYE